MAVTCAGIAIWLYPVLKRQNEALALGSVGARLAEAVFYLVGVVGLLSIVTLSQEFMEEGAPGASYFQSIGATLISVREWSGMTGSVVFILGALMYYYIFLPIKTHTSVVVNLGAYRSAVVDNRGIVAYVRSG